MHRRHVADEGRSVALGESEKDERRRRGKNESVGRAKQRGRLGTRRAESGRIEKEGKTRGGEKDQEQLADARWRT